MNGIEKAEAAVAELQRKREQAVRRATELADERSACSYSAHVQHDHESRKRLSEINQALALHESELASIDAAIAEASKRVAQAEAAEAQEEAVAKAAKLLEVAETMRAVGSDLDSALFALRTSAEALAGLVGTLHGLGIANPNAHQMHSFGWRAIAAALMGTPWAKEFPPVPAG